MKVCPYSVEIYYFQLFFASPMKVLSEDLSVKSWPILWCGVSASPSLPFPSLGACQNNLASMFGRAKAYISFPHENEMHAGIPSSPIKDVGDDAMHSQCAT